jgi:hypothetical protein
MELTVRRQWRWLHRRKRLRFFGMLAGMFELFFYDENGWDSTW